jgi:(p)ppGpp synthase/HD superfamily hydrolase
MDQKARYEKKLLVLRNQLIGARYFNALKALEFALKYHTGTRKDGLTPEFDHQLSICLYVLTLPDLRYREEIVATVFLHDVREDYDITDAEVRELFDDKEFAIRVANAVEAMTKTFRGQKKDEALVFLEIGDDEIASIAKGADRIHNLQSMVGVFKLEKQVSYITEVEELFLPMLKRARRKFPHQVTAYENIKFTLTSQIELIRAIHKA